MNKRMKRASVGALATVLSGICFVANAQEIDGTHTIQVLAQDNPGHGEQFGTSIAVSDSEMVICNWLREAPNGLYTGSAVVWQKNNEGEWFIKQEVFPTDGDDGETFGTAVGCDGNTLVVGAPWRDDFGDRSGAAYIFHKNELGEWIEVTRLLEPNGGQYYEFGLSVAVSGSTAVVATPYSGIAGFRRGAAYIYEDNGEGSWNLVAQFFGSDTKRSLGNALAMTSDTIFVGVPGMKVGPHYAAGGVIVIKKQDGTWQQTQELTFSSHRSSDRFGTSLAVAGNLLAVGAPEYEGNQRYGSIHVYRDSGSGNWAPIQRITGPGTSARDRFATFVGISDQYVVGINRRGRTLLFANDGYDQFNYVHDLFPDHGALDATAIALEGTKGFVGIPNSDRNNDSAGIAFYVDLNEPVSVPADIDSFEITTGTLLSGDTSDLVTSDDLVVNTESGYADNFANLHNMEMIVSLTTNNPDPTSFNVVVESHIDQPAGRTQLRARNWLTGEFDLFQSYATGQSDVSSLFYHLDADYYVDLNAGGLIELSVKHLVFVPFFVYTFESFIDQVEISVD